MMCQCVVVSGKNLPHNLIAKTVALSVWSFILVFYAVVNKMC